MASNWLEVPLSISHVLEILDVNDLALGKDLEAAKKLGQSEIVWEYAFALLDLTENVECLCQVGNFLKKSLLALLLPNVFLLFQSDFWLLKSDLRIECIDVDRYHLVISGYISCC